jgi:SAM-dependent methyltransferase
MQRARRTLKTQRDESRTFRQLREHYEIEKELADKLRTATREERARLYASSYDELFSRVPHHPQVTRKTDMEAQHKVMAGQLKLLQQLINADTIFMEIGPGDCSLSIEVAKRVARVLAVDVSKEITNSENRPANFELILSDGSSIPAPRNSVSLAYSYQLMEHLHPDDAFEQIRNIHAALVSGGCYVCITPNRLSGPHDISKYFDVVARGFHLKEYLTCELADIFKRVGFSRVRVCIGIKGLYFRLPVLPIRWIETALMTLPLRLRRRLAGEFPLKLLLGINIIAIK